MVQYGSLFHACSYFATESFRICAVFALNQSVLPRLSALHCPSSEELLKPKHAAVYVKVFSVLLPSLDQMCACVSCPGKMCWLLLAVFIQP